jgi:predicted DsbA family dithiol-disulfide isomerase
MSTRTVTVRVVTLAELERIAARMGIDDEDFRELLRDEIARRRVAPDGDSPEAPPMHHQQGI